MARVFPRELPRPNVARRKARVEAATRGHVLAITRNPYDLIVRSHAVRRVASRRHCPRGVHRISSVRRGNWSRGFCASSRENTGINRLYKGYLRRLALIRPTSSWGAGLDLRYQRQHSSSGSSSSLVLLLFPRSSGALCASPRFRLCPSRVGQLTAIPMAIRGASSLAARP